MAQHAPADVAAIFAKVETDNAFVIRDMLEAATAMPPDVAATLVPAISRAAQTGNLWTGFKDACDLCVRLADGGELDAAMTLAESLFTPSFAPGREEPSRREMYWYTKGLKEAVPGLAARRPREFLSRMCDWLKASVEAKRHVDAQTGGDWSYVWRPAIEEHEQNSDYDFAGVMAGFVREAFELAIRSENLSLEDGLAIVVRYPYLIFKRIRLHLINEFAEANPELARQVMMDRSLFDDSEFKHEYAMLVGRRWALLTSNDGKTWFGWVDAGPDMSNFDESIRKNLGRDATDSDRTGRIRYWKFERLHWVREHLDDDHRAFYEEMHAQEGEPDMADLNVRSNSGRWGYDSPMSVEDLTSKAFAKAVETVASWRPESQEFRAPDVEGLAATFRQYLATDPIAFSKQANELIGRPAIYVREFIGQMSEAVKAGREINVPAVLDLCSWVVGRPVDERTTPEQRRDQVVDNDWQWTRDEISRFLRNICEARIDDAPRYPFTELRERIWPLVEVLCRDRAESYISRDESTEDPRTIDYLTMGINSSRGKAVEATLEYARWIAVHIKTVRDEQEVVPGGFDSMPEVRTMLEWQIAGENRSFEALSLIGSHVPVIYWIDKEWLAANADRLFDLETIEESPSMAQGWAAWNAFLVWVGPRVDYYGLFSKQFAYAVQQAAQVKLPERAHHQPMEHLGEHLVYFYGRGILRLDDDRALLQRFFAKAHPDIRRHIIGFIGQTLSGTTKIPAEIVNRFMALWGSYWAGAGKHDATEKPNAFSFGAWFACGKFPDEWALKQLEQFVECAAILEPDDAVAERLAKIASTDPARSVSILDRMVRGDKEGWRIHGWTDAAREILVIAMEAGGEARATAEGLINFLGRRGYIKFGELLERK